MRGAVVVADIRLHETPVHPLEALGSGSFLLPGVSLDDLEDLGANALDPVVPVSGGSLAREQQATVYDITFRDGGTGMYAWNAEIHLDRRSDSL
jgi:hypothetical protein